MQPLPEHPMPGDAARTSSPEGIAPVIPLTNPLCDGPSILDPAPHEDVLALFPLEPTTGSDCPHGAFSPHALLAGTSAESAVPRPLPALTRREHHGITIDSALPFPGTASDPDFAGDAESGPTTPTGPPNARTA